MMVQKVEVKVLFFFEMGESLPLPTYSQRNNTPTTDTPTNRQ